MQTTDLYSFEILGHKTGDEIGDKAGDHTGHEIHARISVNEHSSVYAGHFPGFPVTPGVCQVQMIKDILVEALDIPLQLSKARDIKFNNLHEPGKEKTIEGRIKYKMDEHNIIHVNARLFAGDTKYISLRGEFVAYE